MRTIWNGSISFGLVNIPIGLALATQRKDIAFKTLHRECGTPIKQKRWCPVHERDVEADELVKGWEFAKGQFVLVEESDLEAVALTRSQSVDIDRFVSLEDVDPIYFDRTYYLSPADAPAQRRPYVLLLRAMQGAEGDVLALLRDGEPDRDVDQAEVDGSVPDRAHERQKSLAGPGRFSLRSEFPATGGGRRPTCRRTTRSGTRS